MSSHLIKFVRKVDVTFNREFSCGLLVLVPWVKPLSVSDVDNASP